MKNIYAFVLGILLALTMFSACSSSDCVTCVTETENLEFCEDEISFTDINGEPISFDQFIENLEMLGATCN